jgi:hypothetical protein
MSAAEAARASFLYVVMVHRSAGQICGEFLMEAWARGSGDRLTAGDQ